MPEGVVNTITFTGQGSGQYGPYNKYDVTINGQTGGWIIGQDIDPKLQPGETVTYDQLAQNGRWMNWKGIKRGIPGTAQQPAAPPPPPAQMSAPRQPAQQPAKSNDTQLAINRSVALKAAVEMDGHQMQIDAQMGNARTTQERVDAVLSLSEELLEWVVSGTRKQPYMGIETNEAPPIEVYENDPSLIPQQNGDYD